MSESFTKTAWVRIGRRGQGPLGYFVALILGGNSILVRARVFRTQAEVEAEIARIDTLGGAGWLDVCVGGGVHGVDDAQGGYLVVDARQGNHVHEVVSYEQAIARAGRDAVDGAEAVLRLTRREALTSLGASA